MTEEGAGTPATSSSVGMTSCSPTTASNVPDGHFRLAGYLISIGIRAEPSYA